ncbi:NAD(P)H-binding protein [Halocatena marina]|uniref:NAD(P)H-binding protein n=1 Tax=Halocatena marina TaxID=2934937 RepID=UPI00200C2B16|nr:NAD(P)H-binding protein [Halocatena marina]
MNVLVTGATGFVGNSLVPALVSAGHTVTAMTRDASSYDPPDGVSVTECDLLSPETLEDSFQSVDVAYYLVHSLQTGEAFARRDREAAQNFVRAASKAGIERVIYLGGLGETGGELSEHLRSRREVESILDSNEYELTTLRAAIIIGRGSTSFTMIRQLAERLPVMVTPKWVRTECQPIALQDAIAYLVGVLDVPETADETFEIGGPDVLTYQQMLNQTASHLGTDPLIIPVPVLSPALSVYWVDLVTTVPQSVAHPLIYGLKNSVVVTDDRIRDLVPITLTPFDQAIEDVLSE